MAAVVELNRRTMYDVVMVQEPQTHKGRIIGLEAGNGYIIADSKNNPRACIRTNLPCWKQEKLTNRDMAVAIVKTAEGQLCVASMYLDIKEEVKKERFLELVTFCKQVGLPLIIGMDSNAHSGMWGSDEENKRGEQLAELLLELNLFVLNQGGKTPSL